MTEYKNIRKFFVQTEFKLCFKTRIQILFKNIELDSFLIKASLVVCRKKNEKNKRRNPKPKIFLKVAFT